MTCTHGYVLHPDRCQQCAALEFARITGRCRRHGKRPAWGCLECVAAAQVERRPEDAEDPAAYLREPRGEP